jgi:hypothetical protein
MYVNQYRFSTESDDRNDQLTMAASSASRHAPCSILLKWVAEISLEKGEISCQVDMRPSLGLFRGVSGRTNSFVEVANGASQVHILSGCPVTSDLPLPKTIAYFEFTIRHGHRVNVA